MKSHALIYTFLLITALNSSINLYANKKNSYFLKAEKTFSSIFYHYASDNIFLLRETYPFNENHIVTYLVESEQKKTPNPYSYLWPYSGGFATSIALYANSKDPKYLMIIENKIMKGLDLYLDTNRSPSSYASYIENQPLPDRFYDDNIWIGIDFTDLYLLTKKNNYLDKAKDIWKFIETGTDSILGGGIYWCEQRKHSKNTCSNAPAVVYALKLFQATKDTNYLCIGKKLYNWTKTNLQDKNDYLYYDNINLNGRIDKTKYAYNSGQMLQASALLYKFTNDKTYLKEAQKIAESCYSYFFQDFKMTSGKEIHLLRNGDIWFMAVMMRGFIELYNIDKNKIYINSFASNLEYAWNNMREENGLFNNDWTLKTSTQSKWLLTQFGITEMYARLSNLKH